MKKRSAIVSKYQYIQNRNKLYRYPYVESVKTFDFVGEEFDFKNDNWKKTSMSANVKMSGEGVEISESALKNVILTIKANQKK